MVFKTDGTDDLPYTSFAFCLLLRQLFRIAHGWYPDWKEKISDKELSYNEIHTIIWEREHALYGREKEEMQEFFSDDIPDNYRYVINKYQKEMLEHLQGKK